MTDGGDETGEFADRSRSLFLVHRANKSTKLQLKTDTQSEGDKSSHRHRGDGQKTHYLISRRELQFLEALILATWTHSIIY